MATARVGAKFRVFATQWFLPCVALLAPAAGFPQDLMAPAEPGGPVRLFSSDAAVLESQDTRKDLPCTVTPIKPWLGFDMKFHAGYDVVVPLKELTGGENQLTVVFRVVPDSAKDSPVYLKQHFNVPNIDENAGGNSLLQGAFDVGEGKYHVDWLLRDRAERVCTFHWDSDAALQPRDKPMTLDIPAGAVTPMDFEPFKHEPPVARDHADPPLNVKILLNYAPQDSGASAMQPLDVNALTAIMRSISREPRIGKFTVVAFNMQEQKVIARQELVSQIDFPALGKAVANLNLGTVDLKHLSQKHSDSEFLSKLIAKEVADGKESPDAVIFAGPKVVVDDGLQPETLKALGDVKIPVFYMNYNLNPQVNPWRDAIGTAVKAVKGAEYTISKPRDLFFYWTEIVGRIVKSKGGRPGAVTGSGQ